MADVVVLRAAPIVVGRAAGPILATSAPLSFWGGLNPETGEIIDRHHELSGQNLSGCVLALPSGRGSCSASGVLLEAICNGKGPAAIITSRVDPIVGLGAILAEELYGRVVPVAVLEPTDFARLRTGRTASILESGLIEISED